MAPDEEDESEKYFKCCTSKKATVIVCIKCGSVFHPSCVERMKDIKSISHFKIICCENEITTKSVQTFLHRQMNLISESNAQKDTIIKDKEEIINLLQSRIHELEDKLKNVTTQNLQTITHNNVAPKSYSSVVGGGVVVIKPVPGKENNDTKEEIRQKINPIDLGVGVSGIRNARGGSVIIRCRNKDDAGKIKENIDKNLGKQFTSSIPSKKNPYIKIIGIEPGYTEQTLVEAICKQNNDIPENTNFTIKVFKKMRTTYFAILECDPKTFAHIMINMEATLYIGFKRCPVYEYVNVLRCFKCNQFNHKISECPNAELCGKCCSSQHKTKDCDSNKFKCINCSTENRKLNNQLDDSHTTYDLNCPMYLKLVNQVKSKVEYSTV